MLRAHLFLFLALFWIVSGKSCQGDDLEPGSDVRVGTIVKKKCDQINRSKPGQWLRVQYTTKLYSTCEVFYDSRKALGEIAGYVYSLGSREISPAFNFGTNNMCVGEKRRISVPAGMGRWANMMDSGFVVPPNATLTHEVELLDISDAEDVPKDFIDNTIKDPETTKRLVNDDTQVGMIKSLEKQFDRIALTMEMVSDEWIVENRAGLEFEIDQHEGHDKIRTDNRKKKKMEPVPDKHADIIKKVREIWKKADEAKNEL